MVILCTKDWGGLGIALLMQRQGSDVVAGFDYKDLKGTELEHTSKIGDGLLEKMPLPQAWRKFKNTGALWVFDDNQLADYADDLRNVGEQVIGTSKLCHRLEDDRQFGMQIAQQLGFDLPESEEFSDYESGIQFLEEHQEQAWAYKPDAQDPTSTYVPLSKDDPEEANRELVEYLRSLEHGKQPQYVLQEMVQGIEANFEYWLRDGQPVLGFCDLEAKRKLVGDLGENIGCAGDYLFTLPLDHPLLTQTVGKYLTWPELRGYTGSADANVIFAEGKTYFLENCFRFGYNAYATILQELAMAPVEQVFREWVSGQGTMEHLMAPGFGASLSVTVSRPKLGSPIIVPPELEDHTYLYRGYKDETGLHMVEKWSEIACVTAYADSPQIAGGMALNRAEKVAFVDKGYRTDLADVTMENLPLARYAALAESGLLDPYPMDEEVANPEEVAA